MNPKTIASFVPPREIAERLSLHVESVRRMIREGRIRAVRVGGRLRVRTDEVDRIAEESAVIPRSAA